MCQGSLPKNARGSEKSQEIYGAQGVDVFSCFSNNPKVIGMRGPRDIIHW